MSQLLLKLLVDSASKISVLEISLSVQKALDRPCHVLQQELIKKGLALEIRRA